MLKRILGIIGWIGTAIVFAAVAVRFLHPVWERYAYWMAWAGLACIVLYAAGQWREIGHFFARRQARFGTAAITAVLVMLGIVAAINYVASRENKRWDLTASKTYTLSDQTQKLLQKLDAPLKMVVFAKTSDMDRYKLQMPEYQYASRKVSVEYVDPDKKPEIAKQYQIQSYGTIALAYKTRTERVVSESEQDIANGIIKVVTGQQRKLYFVRGHDERDTTSSERQGYAGVVQALGRDNYAAEKLVLAQQADVPADASIVVVAGPKTDYLPQEIEMLRRYLAKGGKLLLLLDPPDKADSPQLPNLLALAHDWDMQLSNDVVLDTSGVGQIFGAGPQIPVAADYPPSAITEGFRVLTAFPLARSVSPVSGGVNGHNAQTFVQTGPNSWATDAVRLLNETKEGKEFKLNEQVDKRGPISIACLVSASAQEPAVAQTDNKGASKSKAETRVVVVGDSDFAANTYLNFQGNKDLFMNMVSWLAQQENLISIRPKEPDDRRLTLTAIQQRNILWLAWVILPCAIIAAGVYTWWRRR